jgi:hypothetical protein
MSRTCSRKVSPKIASRSRSVAKEETHTGLAAEIKIIPTWAWVLAGGAFVAATIVSQSQVVNQR